MSLRKLIPILAFALLCCASLTLAFTPKPAGKIQNLYAYVDGNPTADYQGVIMVQINNEWFWMNGTTDEGKMIYAFLLSAISSGKTIQVTVDDSKVFPNKTYKKIAYVQWTEQP